MDIKEERKPLKLVNASADVVLVINVNVTARINNKIAF